MRSPWLWAGLVALVGVVVVEAVVDGRTWFPLGYGLLAVVLGWWSSPWRGRRGGTTHREVHAMSDTDPRKDVVVYWRPGCPYCAVLRARIGGRGDRVSWVNIWHDEEAAAYVRSVNRGHETVPTVVVDGEPVTNPDPRLVVERLRVPRG